jgi:adenine-specific DNA-methyltransferase
MSTIPKREKHPKNTTPSKIDAASPPQIIKYMGSKAKILPFVIDGVNRVYSGGGVCDLFAGSAILSGAVGRSVKVFSNDIQHYSAYLSEFYLNAWLDPQKHISGQQIVESVEKQVSKRISSLGIEEFTSDLSLKEFNAIEAKHRSLLEHRFRYKYHLFTKCYSGTWWAASQCVWIDALREKAEEFRGTPHFALIIVSLMHAMAYCGSGTGHYAQYRDANTESSMKDISIYRRRSLKDYFLKKYLSLSEHLPSEPPSFDHEITSMDYKERLKTLPTCTVYADPPYAFVHYSRFYHAIETLCLYDFPELQVKAGKVVKGRYRELRHQSPFCIRTQVPAAFADLFLGVAASKSNLVLSYSNTGMINRSELEQLAKDSMKKYDIEVLTSEHTHMTMGRRADRQRDVEEVLIIAKRG